MLFDVRTTRGLPGPRDPGPSRRFFTGKIVPAREDVTTISMMSSARSVQHRSGYLVADFIEPPSLDDTSPQRLLLIRG
jgi:hypothetical protein